MKLLPAEWLRARQQVTAAHLEALGRHGVALSDKTRPLVGVEKVATDGRIYQPGEHGQWAVILACTEWDAPELPWLDDAGRLKPGEPPDPIPYLADLIAFRPEVPDTWTTRICAPATLLGWTHFEIAAARSLPLVLHESPLAWLRGGCAGAVLIDRRGLHDEFRGLAQIECQDEQLGHDIADWLRKPAPLFPGWLHPRPAPFPQILVPESAAA